MHQIYEIWYNILLIIGDMNDCGMIRLSGHWDKVVLKYREYGIQVEIQHLDHASQILVDRRAAYINT
ncbi:hypothetical protein [Terribacillus halophilus]|uniref:hypothetical protein n=1 Tax=Terribacillus halophilus TaxID=361279 RepID=UPI00098486EC|nr:hypothetical protein [Terribacillus halophilus]